jgi:hypothetical protein
VSLWCVWAAFTSVLIDLYLRRRSALEVAGGPLHGVGRV